MSNKISNKLFVFQQTFSIRILAIGLGVSLAILGGYLVNLYGSIVLNLAAALLLAILIFWFPFAGLLLFTSLIPLESAFLGLGGEAASVLRLLGIYIFAVWIGQILMERRKLKLPTVAKWASVFFVWAGISYFWAWNKNVALGSLVTGVQLLALLWLFIDQINDRKRLSAILVALMIGCFTVTLLGLLGVGVQSESQLLTLENQGAKEFGTYVGILFLIGTILLVFKRGWVRVLGLVVAVLSATVLVLVAERGVFLAIGLAWIALAFVSRQRTRTIVGIILLAAFIYFIPPILVQRGLVSASVAERLTVQNVIQTGGSGRVDIWTGGFKVISDNPLAGVGLGNFPLAVYHYLGYASNPHNDWLGVAGELGLVGLFVFIAVLIVIGRRLVNLFRQRADLGKDVLAIIVFALLVYMLSGGLTSNLMWRKVYWLILALATLVPGLLATWRPLKNKAEKVHPRDEASQG